MDISIKSTGDGGDFILTGNDIETTSQLYNQIYLALFGGNVEGSTKREYAQGEPRLDWFANSILFDNDKQKQFNSSTERKLKNVSLTSSGRIEIEQAVIADLAYISELGKTEVEVSLLEENRLSIFVKILEPSGEQSQSLNFIWDSARGEIIKTEII